MNLMEKTKFYRQGKAKRVQHHQNNFVRKTSLSEKEKVRTRNMKIMKKILGIPWQSSGQGSMLPLQGACVRSLVMELRSCKLRCMAKKKKGKKKRKKSHW